ncbi:MAG: BMP family ABC transporter substrate-binding protein [Anaerolineae bacterium]
MTGTFGRRGGRMLVGGVTAGLIAASIIAGPVGAQSPAAGAPDPTICAGKNVAFASVQPRGDKSVVDDSFNGLERTKAELGVAQTTFVEALDPATYESTLTALANAGNNIIVGNFAGMTEPMKAVAPQFPDVRFVHIYADPIDPPIANLRTVSYNYYHAAYLSGMQAAAVSNTGTIGFEAGMYIPGINADYWAYKAGAESINPDIKVLSGEVGSFSDDVKAKEVVSAIISQGADVIFVDGPNVGGIDAAKEKGAFVQHGTPGLIERAPELTIGVPLVSFGESTFDEVAAACAADWAGGHTASGLGDGAIGFYVDEQFLAAGDPAVVAKVEAILPQIEDTKAKIGSGEMTIEFKTDNP